MAAKIGMIIAGVAGVSVLGAGGYFANEWHVCSQMEDDFLNTVDGYASNIYIGELAGVVGVEVDEIAQTKLRQLSLESQERQLMRMYERCGTDKARAAAQLASTELQDSMKGVLSLP